MTTCWTSSGATSAGSMAVAPRSVAGREASPPPILPTGVRAALRMTVVDMMSRVYTYRAPSMRASATTDTPEATGADTVAVGVFEDEAVRRPALAALVASGEARRAFR